MTANSPLCLNRPARQSLYVALRLRDVRPAAAYVFATAVVNCGLTDAVPYNDSEMDRVAAELRTAAVESVINRPAGAPLGWTVVDTSVAD